MDEEDHLMSTSAYLENDEDGDDSYNFPSRPAVDTRMRHLAYNNGYDEKQSSNNNNYDNEDQFYSKKRKESILSDFNNSALHFDDNEGPDDYYDQHNVYDHDQYEDHDPLPINHSKNGYLPEPIPPPSSTADKSRFDKKTNNTRDTNTDKPPPKSFDDIPIKGGSSNPLDDVPIKANPSSMNSFKMDFVMEPKPKTTPPAEKPERSPKSGPFPFLKRGSRKEPSALHKKPQEEKPKVRQDERDFPRSGDYRDAEIVVKAPHSRPSNNNTSSTNLHATNGIGSSRHSQSTSKLGKEELSRNRGNKAPAESYWGLDTTIMEDFHNLRENDQQDRRDQRDQRNRSQGGRQERDNFEESFPGGGEDTLDDIVRRTTQNRNNYRSTNTEVDDDDDVMIGDDYYEDGEEGMDELDHQSVASAEYDRYIQQVKQQSSSWGNVMQPKAVVPNHDNQYNDEEMPRDHGVKQPKVLLAKSTTQRLQQLRSTTPNPRANRTMSNDSAAFPASSNNHTTTSSSASTSVASQNHEGKLVRPVSSLKKDAKPSQSNNNRKSTPGQGKSTNRTNSKGTNGEANFLLVTDEHQKNLEQKMMELQQEIEIFKNKNIKIQKMEKQKEAELADILQKKEDIMKQCEEEKQKTKKWCDDQRQAAERERKLAAKQARDAREKANSNDPPIRKEKAEIEGLKATIEKLKINNDTAQQKWKLDTNRLHELVKDYSNHIENLEKQLVIIEEQKIQLIEFIQENGLKLPKNLRQKLSQTPEVNTITNKDPSIKQMKETLAMKQKTLFQSKTVSKTAGNKGFVEEVDIEVYTPGNNLPASSSYQYKIISEDHQTPGNKGKQSSQARARASSQGEEQFDEDYVRGNGNKTDYNLPPGEVFTRLSSNLKNGFASGSVPSTVTKNKTKPTTSLKSSNNLNASWAVRSSRSSARYSSSLEEEDEGYIDEQNDSANFDEDERERGGGGGRFDSRDDLIGQLLNHHHQQQQKQTTSANPSLSSNVKAQQKNGSSYMNENLPLSSLDPSQSTQGNKATFEKMKSLSSIELDEGYKRSPIPPSRSSHQMQQQQQQQHHNKNTADQGNQGGNVPGTSRTEEVRPDGTRVIHYRNGTIKEINPSGHVLVRFVNGDTKFSDGESGKVIYFYAQANTTHTTFPNGLELYQFPNGQTEKHYPDGKKEVTFPDKTKKIIYVDGTQESIFPDGVILKEFADGTKEVLSSANR